MLGKLLTLSAVTAAAVVGVATPAAATHQPCPTRTVCLVTDPVTIPIGTPAVGPVGAGPFVVPGPVLCNTGTGDCDQTYVVVPGAYVGAGGSIMSSVTIPSFGIAIGHDNTVIAYYGIPDLDPSSSGLPTVTLVAHVVPVPVGIGSPKCAAVNPTTVGPVKLSGSTCLLTVTVTLF